jgi:signal transduction histidine kinase
MTLCRAQLSILTDSLGASLSVVYLTEEAEGEGESKLIPIAVYPDRPIDWSTATTELNVPSLSLPFQEYPKLLAERDRVKKPSGIDPQLSALQWPTDNRVSRRQMLMPLVHEGVILGLLVTTREKRAWNAKEQVEIQHIAQTIALGSILDRQRHWLTTQLQHQQQLQAQQQDLLHNLLHQLRNPLTAIRTFGKLLMRRLQPGDKNQEVASSIIRESDRLQELLQTLETAISLEEAEFPTQAIELTLTTPPPGAQISPSLSGERGAEERRANLLLPNVRELLGDCQLMDILHPLLLSAQAIAQERNLTFHSLIPPHLPQIRANPAALREVLSNLIDNALKYTPSGGMVTVRVESDSEIKPHHLTIAIRDTGLGIPPQDLEHLFQRHYRGVQAQGDIPGTGLGLAIAQELIAQMEGKIEVTSPPLGDDRGTEFLVWLRVGS